MNNPAVDHRPMRRDAVTPPAQRDVAVAALPPDASPMPGDGPATGRSLAIGLLLTILLVGIPLLIYCVLTSG